MANELEQRARLIACELARIDGYDPEDQHGGLYDLRWSGGSNPEPLGDAWSIGYLPKGERIAVALQQAQQPGAAFAAWFAEFDKQNHYPELLAREAWNAALRSQQPGAQAVAWRYVHGPWKSEWQDGQPPIEVREGGYPYQLAYSPPPLPEGVSEEELATAASEALAARDAFALNPVRSTAYAANKADDRLREVLQRRRARLAAKGGV